MSDLSVEEFRALLVSSLGGSVSTVPIQSSSSANACVAHSAVIAAVTPIAVTNPVGVGVPLPSVIPALSSAAVPGVSPCSPVVNLSSEGDVIVSSSSTGVVGSSPDVLAVGKGSSRKRDDTGK